MKQTFLISFLLFTGSTYACQFHIQGSTQACGGTNYTYTLIPDNDIDNITVGTWSSVNGNAYIITQDKTYDPANGDNSLPSILVYWYPNDNGACYPSDIINASPITWHSALHGWKTNQATPCVTLTVNVTTVGTPIASNNWNCGIPQCAQTDLTYMISPVCNATSYCWTYPSNWTPFNTNCVPGVTTFTLLANGMNGGSLYATAYNTSNGCNTQANSGLCTIPFYTLAAPTWNTYPTELLVGCVWNGTINSVPNATSYEWTLVSSSGLLGAWSGSGISTSWRGCAGSHVNFKVRAKNNNCYSPYLTFQYKMGDPNETLYPENFSIFPNPAGDQINVSMNSLKDATISITLSDISGRVVNSETVSLSGGENQIPLNTSDLSNGVYVFKALNDLISVTQQFIIQH